MTAKIGQTRISTQIMLFTGRKERRNRVRADAA